MRGVGQSPRVGARQRNSILAMRARVRRHSERRIRTRDVRCIGVAVRSIRVQARRIRIQPRRRVDVARKYRLGPLDEVLGHDGSSRTVRRREHSGRKIDCDGDDVRRHGPVVGRRPLAVYLIHERSPHRRSEHSALRVRFDLLWLVETHPHAGDEIRRRWWREARARNRIGEAEVDSTSRMP